jgi:hypothetical protein
LAVVLYLIAKVFKSLREIHFANPEDLKEDLPRTDHNLIVTKRFLGGKRSKELGQRLEFPDHEHCALRKE